MKKGDTDVRQQQKQRAPCLYLYSVLSHQGTRSAVKERHTAPWWGKPEKIPVGITCTESLFPMIGPKVDPGKDSGASVFWQLKAAIKPARFERPNTEK